MRRNADHSLTTSRVRTATLRSIRSSPANLVCEDLSAIRGNAVNDYKPLLSSAPAHSILNAQAFHYTNSVETDIRKTFARVARNLAMARAV